MNTEHYQGWTNRETWAVYQHINNDLAFYHYVKTAQQLIAEGVEAEHAEQIADDSTLKIATSIRFSNWLQEHFEELTVTPVNQLRGPEVLEMLFDIGSLWRVNWAEIATALTDQQVTRGAAQL
jgi:hypothetical protein